MTDYLTDSARDLQAVFPLKRVRLEDGIELRPLVKTDVEELFEILGNDPDMTWTRRPWSMENIEYLLGLRLSHYEKFGFGVYGVVFRDRLVGMAGLQSVDGEPDDFEFVAYIKRDLWGLGLSTTIGKWIIEKVSNASCLNAIYASTRHENKAAISLAERLGFQKIGEKEHYGFPAIEWALKING